MRPEILSLDRFWDFALMKKWLEVTPSTVLGGLAWSEAPRLKSEDCDSNTCCLTARQVAFLLDWVELPLRQILKYSYIFRHFHGFYILKMTESVVPQIFNTIHIPADSGSKERSLHWHAVNRWQISSSFHGSRAGRCCPALHDPPSRSTTSSDSSGWFRMMAPWFSPNFNNLGISRTSTQDTRKETRDMEPHLASRGSCSARWSTLLAPSTSMYASIREASRIFRHDLEPPVEELRDSSHRFLRWKLKLNHVVV